MPGHWRVIGGYPGGPKNVKKTPGQMSIFTDDGEQAKAWKKKMHMEMEELLLGALNEASARRRAVAPRWAYHQTYWSDLLSIKKQGLVPAISKDEWGESWDSESQGVDDNTPLIWFANVFGADLGAAFDSETCVWVRFPWPSDVEAPAAKGPNEFATKQRIPASKILVCLDGEAGRKWKPLSAITKEAIDRILYGGDEDY